MADDPPRTRAARAAAERALIRIVHAHAASPSVDSSPVTNASGAPCRRRTASSSAGNLRNTVAAGARGTNTGNNVDSLTNNATCGLQRIAVAYHAPSDGAAEGVVGTDANPPRR